MDDSFELYDLRVEIVDSKLTFGKVGSTNCADGTKIQVKIRRVCNTTDRNSKKFPVLRKNDQKQLRPPKYMKIH